MLISIVLQFSVLIFAITIHELSHGWAAYKLGDPTAKYMGRLTLNPLAHIDLFGTIILPLMLVMLRLPAIGWAKPVPVNSLSLKNPKTDMFWVGLAGPVANFLMAFIFATIIKLYPAISTTLAGKVMIYGVLINLVLAAFNLMPIPPLDGSRILGALLPWRYLSYYNKIEPYGFIIIVALIWSGVFRKLVSLLFLLIVKYLNTPIWLN